MNPALYNDSMSTLEDPTISQNANTEDVEDEEKVEDSLLSVSAASRKHQVKDMSPLTLFKNPMVLMLVAAVVLSLFGGLMFRGRKTGDKVLTPTDLLTVTGEDATEALALAAVPTPAVPIVPVPQVVPDIPSPVIPDPDVQSQAEIEAKNKSDLEKKEGEEEKKDAETPVSPTPTPASPGFFRKMYNRVFGPKAPAATEGSSDTATSTEAPKPEIKTSSP